MASWSPIELLLICVIALIILGPKRLPEVANKVGTWVGKARRMTRVLKRQLEEELDIEQGLNVRPKIQAYVPPNDDDTYSPMHPPAGSVKAGAGSETAATAVQPPQTSTDADEAPEDPASPDQDTSAGAENADTDNDDGDRRKD